MRLLTLARDLRRRKARERQGLFVAEGVRAVEEVLRAAATGRVRVEGALVAPALDATPRGAALRRSLDAALGAAHRPVHAVSDAEFASAADTEAPQGVLVVAAVPRHPLADLAAGLRMAAPGSEARLVVLDGVQDPGNVGTILRAAAALGATAVVTLPGTVDPWSAKVVRAGMGAHFARPIVAADAESLAALLSAESVPLWGAAGEGEPVAAAAERAPVRLALALGNEGAGLSPGLRARLDRLVAVPSTGLVESLNVAVAAAILLYELRPGALRGEAAPGPAPIQVDRAPG